MKVVILAGGFGTRLSEYTESIPKPMVKIGNNPILWHVMKHYSKYNHKEFLLALGYKSETIKDYFLNYRSTNDDFTIDFSTGKISYHSSLLEEDWKVTLVSTGLNSMTGGRVKRMKKYINNETFLLTYGDGLSNVNLDKLIKFHKSKGKLITVTAVRPIARFGEIKISNDIVKDFKEKPQLPSGWINGGFFVVEPEFLNLIDGDETVLEKNPLEKAAQMGELAAFRHEDFWQCMDTKRDKDYLENLYKLDKVPWEN